MSHKNKIKDKEHHHYQIDNDDNTTSSTIPLYMQNLLDSTWFTADRQKPYMIKAGAVASDGYAMIVTDLEYTYFCAGDRRTLEKEKQKFNPTIETESYEQLIALVNDAFSKYDANATYHFKKLSRDQLHLKLQKQLDIYPFKWEFYCIKIPHEDHLIILRDYLIAPLISTVNSLENKYQILLKRHHHIEQQLRDKLYTAQEKQKFQVFQDDQQVWTKSISMDEISAHPVTIISKNYGGNNEERTVKNMIEFPQLRNHDSVNFIFTTIQQHKYHNSYDQQQHQNLKKRDYNEISPSNFEEGDNNDDSDDYNSLDYLYSAIQQKHDNKQQKSSHMDDLRDSKKKMKNLKLDDKPNHKKVPLLHDEEEDESDIDPEEQKRRQEIERKLHKPPKQQQQLHQHQKQKIPSPAGGGLAIVNSDYQDYDQFDSQQVPALSQQVNKKDEGDADDHKVKKKPKKNLKFV